MNTHGTTADEPGDTQINLYETLAGDHHPQGSTQGKRISKEEKHCRFQANQCFYCGKPSHHVRDCKLKKSQLQERPSGGGRNTKTRQMTVDDSEAQEEAAPKYKSQKETQIGWFYMNADRYNIVRPHSAPVNEDF
jgi:hypothetical protein